MDSKLDLIISRLGNVEAKLDTNTSTVEELRKELMELKDGNADVVIAMDKLEEKVGDIAEDVDEINQKVKNIEATNKSIENRVVELEMSVETELVRTECIVEKYMEVNMKKIVEKCKENMTEERMENNRELL